MRVELSVSSPEIDAQIEALDAQFFLYAFVGSNLKYMPRLEAGHSKQYPKGIYAPQQAALGAQVAADVGDAFAAHQQGDVVEILAQGLNLSALGVARALADATPVDTGRAKNSWIVVPAMRKSSQTTSLMVGMGGRLQPEGGYAIAQPMSAEQQKAKRQQLNAARTAAKIKARQASSDALTPKTARNNPNAKTSIRRAPGKR